MSSSGQLDITVEDVRSLPWDAHGKKTNAPSEEPPPNPSPMLPGLRQTEITDGPDGLRVYDAVNIHGLQGEDRRLNGLNGIIVSEARGEPLSRLVELIFPDQFNDGIFAQNVEVSCMSLVRRLGLEYFAPAVPPSDLLRQYPTMPSFFEVGGTYQAERTAQELTEDASDCSDYDKMHYLSSRSLDSFRFCCEAYTLLGRCHIDGPPAMHSPIHALAAYIRAIHCAFLVRPILKSGRDFEWGNMEVRPCARVMQLLASALEKSGDVKGAVIVAKRLLRMLPGHSIMPIALHWIAASGSGESLASASAFDAEFGASFGGVSSLYARLLIELGKRAKESADDPARDTNLTGMLAKALEANVFVPIYLLDPKPLPPNPSSISYREPDEAINYAHFARSAWRKVEGALQCLAEASERGGKVPPESTLTQLLGKSEDVLVRVAGCEAVMRCTRVVDKRGWGLQDVAALPPSFHRLGAGEPIHVIKNHAGHDSDSNGVRSFLYSEVEEVPFWSVLAAAQATSDKDKADRKKKEANSADAGECANCLIAGSRDGVRLLACARCGLVKYCGKACQAQHWRAGHKKQCVSKAERRVPQGCGGGKGSVGSSNSSSSTSTRLPGGGGNTSSGDGEELCAICLEPFDPTVPISVLACSHEFHHKCVLDLHENSATLACPLCREALPSASTRQHGLAAEESWDDDEEEDCYGDEYSDEEGYESMYGFDGGYCGFSASDCDELMMQGVKPWDDDAAAVLGALHGYY